MGAKKRRSLRVFLLVVFILGSLLAWITFTKGGFIYLHRMEAKRQSHINRIDKLIQEKQALMEEIKRLRDEKYIELLARKELGLVRENEIIYRFKEKDQNQN